MPSTGSATIRTGAGGGGSSTSSQAPAVHPVRLAAAALPSSNTFPVGGQFGGLGAGEAEHPGDGGVYALALESLGYGQGAGFGKRAHLIEYAGRRGAPVHRAVR